MHLNIFLILIYLYMYGGKKFLIYILYILYFKHSDEFKRSCPQNSFKAYMY